MDCSVIIVSYNTRELLKYCIESIYSITERNNEIIVVDNNSEDNTVDMLENNFPKVKIIENDSNYGFGRANNQGMKVSKSEYILLLNSDTMASPAAIYESKKYIECNPEVGVLGCGLLDKKGNIQLSCGRFLRLSHAIYGGIEFNNILKTLGINREIGADHYLSENDHLKIQEVDWTTGAFMFLRKEVFKTTNGFDENIFLYGEEHEWCFRIKSFGWKIVYNPNITIIHFGKSSSANISDIKRYRYILDGEYYYFKIHYGLCKAILFKYLLTLFSIIKLPIWSIVYILSGFKPYIKTKLLYQLSILRWSI